MSDEGDGFDLSHAIEEGAKRVRRYKDAFGVQHEQHICEHCDVACQASTTYNPNTAAFDGGASPCWACPECGRNYVRDASTDTVTMDLYDRDE
jgi:uncharacterized protein with PIN domain